MKTKQSTNDKTMLRQICQMSIIDLKVEPTHEKRSQDLEENERNLPTHIRFINAKMKTNGTFLNLKNLLMIVLLLIYNNFSIRSKKLSAKTEIN